MARYWGQQKEEALTTVGGGSENLQGVSASDRKRWDGKQDQLAYDNKPMRGSVNVLNSDAIARAFEEFKDAISTAYKQYLNTQVTSYAEMVTAVTNAKNDVDNAYAAIEKYETNMRVLYEDTLSKLTDAQNILAGATTLLNKTNTESSALSAKIKQLDSVHSSIISDLGVLRNALAEVSNDADGAQLRIEELISKANGVDTHVADLVKTVEDALAEIETEKEDTLAKIRAVRDSIPDDYEKVCEDIKDIRQELIDARRRGTWITSETASGEMVHATNCAPVPPLNIRLYGKTEQDGTEGNQLFDFEAEKLITGNNTLESADNGYSIKYTCLKSGESIRIRLDHSLFKANTTYLLIADKKPEKCTIQCSASTYTEKKIVNGVLQGSSLRTSVVVGNIDFSQFEEFNQENFFAITIYVADSAYIGEHIIKGLRLIEEGTNQTVWEPFTGNEPSPNMNYPQPTNHLGASGSIVGKVLNKNLFPVGEWGGEIQRNALIGNTMIRVIANTTYYCSFYAKLVREDISTQSMRYRYYKEKASAYSEENTLLMGDIIARITATEQWFTFTFTPTQDCWFGLDYGDTFGGSKYRDIIVSQVDNIYKPYTEQLFTALTPNGLKGIPLGTTIPNAIKNSPIHMSGVYWDNADGKYYISDTKDYESGKSVQRIFKEQLLDYNAYMLDSLSDENSTFFYVGLPRHYSGWGNEFICDIVSPKMNLTNVSFVQNGGWLNPANPTVLYIRLKKDSGITTLEEFKEYLTNNEVYVTLILPEPIVTDPTQEELDQYNSLVMNYPITNVVNDAGAYMEVEYGKDAEAYINENYTPKSEHEALAQRVKTLEEEIIKL